MSFLIKEKYTLLDKLGESPLSAVFNALDEKNKTPVVIKKFKEIVWQPLTAMVRSEGTL